MASTIIHLAIAKKVQEKLEVKNPRDYYLGSIAPDISRQIGLNREESHFLVNTKDDVPNLSLFVKRYPLFQYNSFNLGYFTHLYTDKVWKEKFLPTFVKEDSIQLLDGSTLKANLEEINNMIYSDYTNLNTKIIDEYALDLSLFYDDFVLPDTSIQEVPIEKLDILLNKISLIIENTKSQKTYTLHFNSIKKFIDETAEKIIEEVKKY